MHTRLTQAQKDATRRESLTTQKGETGRYQEENRLTIAAAEKRLAKLCRQAGCQDYHDLERLEGVSQEFLDIEAKMTQVQDHLLEHAGGASLEEFMAEARKFSPDEL